MVSVNGLPQSGNPFPETKSEHRSAFPEINGSHCEPLISANGGLLCNPPFPETIVPLRGTIVSANAEFADGKSAFPENIKKSYKSIIQY